jgi:hypothetical protein
VADSGNHRVQKFIRKTTATACKLQQTTAVLLATVSFPLTPALSPEERENRYPVCCESGAPRWFERWTACHPLPWGEGRSEGEESVRSPIVHEWEVRFIGRVGVWGERVTAEPTALMTDPGFVCAPFELLTPHPYSFSPLRGEGKLSSSPRRQSRNGRYERRETHSPSRISHRASRIAPK